LKIFICGLVELFWLERKLGITTNEE
jgi:hypothetical protein